MVHDIGDIREVTEWPGDEEGPEQVEMEVVEKTEKENGAVIVREVPT